MDNAKQGQVEGSEEARERFAPPETHLIRSTHVAQTFKVQVMRPTRKKGESAKFPVVYATDGNLTFDVLKGISYGLQLSEEVAPRFLLVGIGYPSDSPWAGAILRGRDLTSPGFPRISRKPPHGTGYCCPKRGQRTLKAPKTSRCLSATSSSLSSKESTRRSRAVAPTSATRRVGASDCLHCSRGLNYLGTT